MKSCYLFCLLLISSTCALSQPMASSPKSGESDSPPTEKLDSLFRQYFRPDAPGGAVLIAKNGKVIFSKGYGVEDMVSRRPVTTKTIFNTGSVSKTFVAYGILKLAEEKKLSLEDALYRYFPDFQDTAIAKKIKLYHLLTHSSGLPDNRNVQQDSIFYLTAKDTQNFAPLKATRQLHFEPGTDFEYSNPAFNGLALIIEKVSGKKWQQYIREMIFKPAGMTLSTITDGPHPQQHVAHGYVQSAPHTFTERDYGEEPTFAAAGNGGIWSSVEELWLYEQAIQKAAFMSSEMIRLSRTIYPLPDWKSKTPPFMGLSWFIDGPPRPMIGHTGSQGGFRADYQWLPEQGLFYVILTNTPQPLRDIRQKVQQLLLP